MIWQIVFGAAFVIACGYTIFGYPYRYGALTGRSRLFRTIGMFLLDLLSGLALLFTLLDFHADVPARIANLRILLYLASCVCLGLALLCVALLDTFEALVVFRREKRTIAAQILQDEIERAEQRRAERQMSNQNQSGNSSNTGNHLNNDSGGA